MKKTKLLLLPFLATVTLSLAACGNSSTQSKGAKTQSLNWMQNANLITLDPSKCIDTISSTTLNNVDRGLFFSPSSSKYEYGVAKSMKVSKDGKTYTFDLRKSKWSNGDPVTASDFVYGFQRTVDPKTASQDAYLMDHLLNYKEVSTGKLSPDKLGVSAPNKYTFVVKLSSPQSYFKSLLTDSAFLPQDKKVAVKYGKKYGTSSSTQVYNGPFTVTGWTGTNDSWTLAKNKNYYDASTVRLNKVNMKVVKDQQTGLNEYQTGSLDELSLSGKQQVKNFKGSKELHTYKTMYSNYLELNEQKDPEFKNLKLREALSLAIDRKDYVTDVLGDGSNPTKGFVADGLANYKGKDFAAATYVKGTADYNLDKAKKLWKEGLKEVGKKSLNLTLTYDDTDVAKATTEYLQAEFQKLPGLKVSNVNLPRQQRISRLFSGNFDLVVTGWDPGYADPISALNIRTSNSSINFSKWQNSEFDNYINKSNTVDANNPAKRWDDLVKAGKLVNKEVGAVPFYQTSNPVALKTNVKGVTFNPVGSWDFSHGYVE